MQSAIQNCKSNYKIKTTFYGWDGDRLVLTEKGDQHIHTIYEPNTFIPLIRIEGKRQPPMKTLAQKVAQHTQIKLIPQNVELFHKIEQQMRAGKLDEDIQAYLIKTGSSVQMLKDMLDDEPDLTDKTIHFYHYDHLGTPIALINEQGEVDWQISLDPWGNTIKEHNPKNIQQPIRFQGQHYDEESGLHYNRHRYYDPRIGRYITQDPVGLRGGGNWYRYAFKNPVNHIDPKGLLGGQQAVANYIQNSDIQVEAEVGGSGAFGLGVSTTQDVTHGLLSGVTCHVNNICGLIGPLAGGASEANVTGSVGPKPESGITWTLGVAVSEAIGLGPLEKFALALMPLQVEV